MGVHVERTSADHGDGACHDRGFTLVELLIVIVILGILATVTVFAVRGITDQGGESACASELRMLTTAQEAHLALHGDYADETALVSSGGLHSDSSLYEVTVAADGSYSITPAAASSCTGSATGGGSGGPPPADPPPDPPPPDPPVEPTPISFGGIPAWQYGATGADEVVVLGRAEGEADWRAMINVAPPTSRRVTFIDLDQVDSQSDVDYVMNRSRTNGVTDFALYVDDDTVSIARAGGGTWPSVDAYLASAAAPDPYHRLDGSGPTIESLLRSLG